MSSATPVRGHRVPSLDGLRGLALLAVLAYHAAPGWFPGGFLGVEVFFVLSGYLLASLLLEEHERDGRIDLVAYARRRARRIFPALLALVAVLGVAGAAIAPDAAHRLIADLAASAGGVVNWYFIADGESYFARFGRPSLVRHLWSIAVELQAYVVLAGLLWWLARRSRRAVAVGAGVVCIASFVAMGLLYVSPEPIRAYYGTDARIGAVLTGALLAATFAGRPPDLSLGGRVLPALGGAGLLASVFLADETARAMYSVGFVVIQACTVVLLVGSSRPGVTRSVLDAPALRWLGRRSYGIYLWHWPIVALTRPGIDVSLPHAAVVILGAGGAVSLGALSYAGIERPVLEGRFLAPLRGRSKVSLAAAGTLAVSLALANVAAMAPVDPIEESLRVGERVVARQSVRTTTPQPSGVERDPAATPDAPPPPRIHVSALGDSVMLGAAPALTERLGPQGIVDATISRHFTDGVEIVEGWNTSGRLGRVLIVHLGNNGPVRRDEIDAMLVAARPADHVLLVTVRVNRPWQDEVNDALRAAALAYQRVTLVDWFAHSEGRRGWFHTDGTHLGSTGSAAYAALLLAAVPPPPPIVPTPEPTASPTPVPTPEAIPTPAPLPAPA